MRVTNRRENRREPEIATLIIIKLGIPSTGTVGDGIVIR